MKASTTLRICAVAATLLAPACATIEPSPELVTARSTYAVATAPGTAVAQAPLLDAQRELDAAENEHAYNPQSVHERHLAYLATRDAQLAMAQGSARDAKAEADAAKARYSALLEGQVSDQKVALNQALRERDAAVKRVAKLTNVTPSGHMFAVQFEVNESRLLPAAQERLDAVVEAIGHMDPGQQIVVVGHADATGESTYNDKLAQQRAEAVRDYLISKGADANRIVAAGRGEGKPIASNESAEGRANNRRVEIIIRHAQTAER